LNDIAGRAAYADLFTEIPEHRFRFDTPHPDSRAGTCIFMGDTGYERSCSSVRMMEALVGSGGHPSHVGRGRRERAGVDDRQTYGNPDPRFRRMANEWVSFVVG